MQKTIYKWGQYYLMYSPVWKLLTRHSVVSKQNFNNPRTDKAYMPKEDIFKVTSIEERPKVIEKLCTKKPLNIRLFVAHSVLLGVPIYVKVLNQNLFQKDIEASCQFWSEQKTQITQKITQIIRKFHQSSKFMNYPQQAQLLTAVQQFFGLGFCPNISRPQTQQDRAYYQKRQEQLRPQLNIYNITQIRKRILIKEVIAFIQKSPIINLKSPKQTKFDQDSLNIAEKTILMQVTVRLVSQLLKQKSLYLEEEEIDDWIATLFRQSSCLQIITEKLFSYLSKAIFTSNDSCRYNLKDINNLMQLYNKLKELVQLLQNTCQKNSKIDSEANIQQMQSFITYFNAFYLGDKVIWTHLSEEIKKILSIKQSIQLCLNVYKGQTEEKDLSQLKISQSKQIEVSNRKSGKFEIKAFTVQFNLWKLNFLIEGMIQLDQGIKFDMKGPELDLLKKHLHSQIYKLLSTFSQGIQSSKSNNKPLSDKTVFQLNQSLSLVSTCEFLMAYNPINGQQETNFRKFRTSISSNLQKIHESHLKQIFNHKFEHLSLQSIILTLETVVKSSQINQIVPYWFQTLKRTKLLSNLLRTLHKLIVKQKQHILLSAQTKAILVQCIEFFSEHKHSSSIFGKEQRQYMNKTLEKIKG